MYESRNDPMGLNAFWSEVLVVCHGRKNMLLLVWGFSTSLFGANTWGTEDRGSHISYIFVSHDGCNMFNTTALHSLTAMFPNNRITNAAGEAILNLRLPKHF